MDFGFLTLPILAFVSLFSFAVISEDTEVIITEFSVPSSIEATGYTSDVVTNRIGGAYQLITHKARTAKSQRPFGQSNQQTFVKSLVKRYNTEELVNAAREDLGMISFTIGGSIIGASDGTWLVRVNVRRPERPTEVRFLSGSPDKPEELFFRVGLEVTEAVDPYVVASYHYETALDVGSDDFSKTRTAILRAYPRVAQKNHHWLHNLWGLTLLREGRPSESIEEFKKALQIKNDFPLSIHNWGLALIEMEQYEAAIRKFRNVISIDKEGHRTIRALSQWAYAETLLDRTGRSEILFKKALSIDPTDALLHYIWGKAYEYRGQLEAAAEQYRLATLYDPTRTTYSDDLKRVAGYSSETMPTLH